MGFLGRVSDAVFGVLRLGLSGDIKRAGSPTREASGAERES